VRYESIIVDTAHERFTNHYFQFWGELFTHFVAGASISRSGLSRVTEARRKPFEEKVAVREATFVVAHQADNTTFEGLAFSSHAEATAHLQATVAANPSLAESIHVIPTAEVNVPA
jgi:phage tail protein X